jgi:hypothetical protein
MSERIASRSTGGEGSTGGNTPADAGSGARAPITQRIQASVSGAKDEHRANAAAGTNSKGRGPGSPRKAPRRARLRLTRIDPWTVMKTSFLLSVAFGVVTFVAVFMVWSVLGAAGVWESINATVASVVEADDDSSGFDVTDYLGTGRVLGFTLLVSVIDVILLTAIATLTAFLYNMAAALLGGIEVTLAEDER